MEDEYNNSDSNLNFINLIKATYSCNSDQERKAAENKLIQAFQLPGFIAMIFSFLSPLKSYELNFRKGVANLIKKFTYDFSRREGEKMLLAQKLVETILEEGLQISIRELLGIGLEYLFNQDEEQEYKQEMIRRVFEVMEQKNDLKMLSGGLIISVAYANSLIDVQDQISFVESSLKTLHRYAIQLYEEIAKMPIEQFLVKANYLIPIVTKIFYFYEIVTERIFDEEEFHEQEVSRLRKNSYFIDLFQKYLLLQHDHHSMINKKCPQVNGVKYRMVNIIKTVYLTRQIPLKIFQIIYLTFLAECNAIISDPDVQQILAICLQLMHNQLDQKFYYNLFLENKIETIFALFIYSGTSQEQLSYMNEQPQKFEQIAHEYSQAIQKSPYLKVQASCFFHVLIHRIDEAGRNLLQILIVILTGTLNVNNYDSETMTAIKKQFQNYQFFGLTTEQRMQVSLMILATISPYVNKRPDMANVIYAFFLTQFDSLAKIQNQLVILRLIRTVSYYPSAIYFLYIKTQMARGKVFLLQGIKAFERILRTNKFAELLPLLSKIISQLIGVISISDPIFQLVTLNFYDKMLKTSPDLYILCLNKVKEQFRNNLNKNQHNTNICFNMLNGLIRKQKDLFDLSAVQTVFFEIVDHIATSLELYLRYEHKIIEIFLVLITKRPSIPQQIEKFAQNSLLNIKFQYKGSTIFKFYNLFFLKLDNTPYKIDPYFKLFLEEINRRFTLCNNEQGIKEHLDVITYYCFLASQILSCFKEIKLAEEEVIKLLNYTQHLMNVHPTYQQFSFAVVLTNIYISPLYIINYLKQQSLYQKLLQMLNAAKFEGKIFRKIVLLCLIKLLQVEDNQDYLREILNQCIFHLNHQRDKNTVKLKYISTFETRPRTLYQETTIAKEECMEEEDNSNELVNLFCNFKHPFDSLSEYDQFKVIFWQSEHQFGALDESIKQNLRNILGTQWVENKTRVIRHVKRI